MIIIISLLTTYCQLHGMEIFLYLVDKHNIIVVLDIKVGLNRILTVPSIPSYMKKEEKSEAKAKKNISLIYGSMFPLDH